MSFPENKHTFDVDFGETQKVTGLNGVSPIVEVEKIEGGNRITITDAKGTKTVDVMDGRQGDKGADYVLTDPDKDEIASLAGFPKVTAEDEGKFMRVSANGVWEAQSLVNGNEVDY